ncbi:low molecular weight protein tyrosine phosphatase family protein [Methylobacterium sp. E-066]|uniref:low molecular weight protein tyrosine phosphatase family protein n=1 Tax=Methylobacterium sp. E-066 TaxID=2836584 RepID=UPI001FB86D94|nr:phosphotyrosine protein phosphatase [Methylobacterium sp. E-066]MCJ2140174.1 phosphotyrosine protein phosphatase [Methylobacterium sp. E-066]
MRILFVCGRARARSPTAEQIFARRPGIEAASAGVSPDADEPVEADHLAWAEIVVVMERAHRRKLMRRFGPALRRTRLVCLDIPDAYGFMEPALVRLLEARAGRFVRTERVRPDA